ncbi:MAG: hypothetical protein ACI8RZ_002190 [Myxococcota bacterium]|jgi:hypothetical protein
MPTSILLAILIGCRTGDKIDEEEIIDTGGVTETPDADADGYDADEDCDDANSVVNPGAAEICDGVDNNCDGVVDESVTTTFYADTDGDGFGDSDAPTEACEQPAGYVPIGNDCDDANGEAYPSAPERCDGLDNDCDGEIDEDLTEYWYADADGDGAGDPDAGLETCDPKQGYVETGEDCDDTDPTAFPDGEEVCDTVDNDCDGDTDEGVTTTYYEDVDADSYGVSDSTTESCDLPTGYADSTGDCDDADSAINPDATEICDDLDNDCDGTIDENTTDATTWYADADSDGYGDATDSALSCDQPTGYVADDTDCDDAESAANPGASEVCDEIDNDCDGSTDEGVTETFYADTDADGFGDSTATTADCSVPSGYAADSTDCDDSDSAINPDASEVCNDTDDDCDGSIDEGVTETFYADDDADGYGDADSTTTDCEAPSGYSADATDCDDGDSAINPGASEVCDELDNDCDGSIDEGAAGTDIFYADDDGDGYGDPDLSTTDCEAPSGYVENGEDCDDGNNTISPDGTESCNGEDDDCDTDIDEGLLGTGEDCPADDCLTILTEDSTAAGGDYWIDFDGTATETECDMTTDGGGWTLIFEDDFESTPDAGWSLSTTTTCGSWSDILGGYGVMAGGEIDITVDTYALSHTEIWVDLYYLALDSWDSETAYVEVDGTSIFSQTQNNHSSSYSEVCGWNRGYNGSYDSRHAISEIVNHTDSVIEMIAGSTLDQASTDESFGIDDVTVWVR